MNLITVPKRFPSSISHFFRTHYRSLTTHIVKSHLPNDGHAAHLSFTGAKKHPILDPDALTTLTGAIETATSQPGIRVLFLRSTIAGADLKHMRDITSAAAARAFIRQIDRLCTAAQDSPVPVVAVIDGPCLGAGMELAASCDFRIAVGDERTVFGMPETRVGLPSVVQACLLPGLMGWARAREVLYFGETFGAERACEWGFVNEVVQRAELEGALRRWETRVARTGTQALGAQKRLMRVCEESGCGREGIEASIEAFGTAFEGDEPARMIGEFFDVRSRKLRE